MAIAELTLIGIVIMFTGLLFIGQLSGMKPLDVLLL